MNDYVMADCGIRQLHARYADAVWRQDAASFADCFAPDGVWKIAGMAPTGRAAIAEACAMLLGRSERIQLIVGQPILALCEGGATGRLQVTEFARKRDGTSAITFGIYHDVYARADDRWLFARRHWDMAYHGPIDLSGPFVAPPDHGPFPGAPAADAPTHVRKA